MGRTRPADADAGIAFFSALSRDSNTALRDHFQALLDNTRSWEELHGSRPMVMLSRKLSKTLPGHSTDRNFEADAQEIHDPGQLRVLSRLVREEFG